MGEGLVGIMKIKYSVIIPHFNDEEGLVRLLGSIPSRGDIQVVVVDDRSHSDKFVSVIEGSSLPNIQFIVNDRTKSAGTCRNIGLENASGKYLVFADADDVFTEHAFSYFDEAIIKDPTAELYFFNVDSVKVNGAQGTRHLKNRELVLNYIEKKGLYYEDKLRLTHNVPWGKLVKKELVDKHGICFDQTIIANDGIFSLKVGKAARIISASPEVVYCVTARETSLTRQKDVSKYRVRLEVYVRYFHFLSDDEKRKINASPIPLLYLSVSYGIAEFFRSVYFLLKNDVSVFKYFKFKKRFFTAILALSGAK